MHCAELLTDAFGRIREAVHAVVADLGTDELSARLDDHANSIAWLVWHLTRVQDDHVAEAMGLEQVARSGHWEERFGFPFAPGATGYGHRTEEVTAVRVDDPGLLTGYHDAVHDQTVAALGGVSAVDLDRVVDRRWDPPVTLGVRLVSVIDDDLEHVGQAAFIRGVLLRRR